MTIYSITRMSNRRTARINRPTLHEFIHDFSDNLKHEYPVPGYVPRIARDWRADPVSYTYVLINSQGYEGPESRKILVNSCQRLWSLV